MIISQQERALRLAVEHCDWCREQGQTPREVLLSIKPQAMSARMTALLTWDDVIDAISRAWMRLR